MQALRGLAKRISWPFWWPAIVGVVFLLGCAALAIVQVVPSSGSKQRLFGSTEYYQDRTSRGAYLAASIKNAAVLVRAPGTDNIQLLLIDFGTGRKIRIGSEGAHLMFPHLSPDGAQLLFTREVLGREGHELIACEILYLKCRTLLKSAASIRSPLEISGHRVLYVSSPWRRPDGRVRFIHNDIWLLDPATGPHQLTDFQLYELSSLSVSRDSIYLSGLGPRPEKPVIPKYEPDSNAQSDIFRLPFDHGTGAIVVPAGMLEPLFAGAGLATRPSTSADGSLVAFLRSRTLYPRRYVLVIADRTKNTEQLIEMSGLQISQPVIIGRDVYVANMKDDRVLIQIARPEVSEMKLLADIDDASAAAAEAIDLRVTP